MSLPLKRSRPDEPITSNWDESLPPYMDGNDVQPGQKRKGEEIQPNNGKEKTNSKDGIRYTIIDVSGPTRHICFLHVVNTEGSSHHP